MRFTYELQGLDKAALIVLLNSPDCKRYSTDLRRSVNIVISSDYQYVGLLKLVITQPQRLWWFPSPSSEGAVTQAQLDSMLDVLSALGLLTKTTEEIKEKRFLFFETSRPASFSEITLTQEGARIASSVQEGRIPILRLPPARQATIFVASAFSQPELDRLFEVEVAPACVAAGYLPFRVDLSEPTQTITDEILRAIRGARCVIADLTFARPSVYFEIGVAHGMGIPLVLTCRRDHLRSSIEGARVHFDLEQYKISFWTEDPDGSFRWDNQMRPMDRLKTVLLNAGAII